MFQSERELQAAHVNIEPEGAVASDTPQLLFGPHVIIYPAFRPFDLNTACVLGVVGARLNKIYLTWAEVGGGVAFVRESTEWKAGTRLCKTNPQNGRMIVAYIGALF